MKVTERIHIRHLPFLGFLALVCMAFAIGVGTPAAAKKHSVNEEALELARLAGEEQMAHGGADGVDGDTRHVHLHNKDNILPIEYDREFFHVGDHGYLTFSTAEGGLDIPGAPSDVRSEMVDLSSNDEFADTKITYSVDKPEILTIDENRHIYRILEGGEATVILSAKIQIEDKTSPTGYRSETWLAKFTFIIMGDTSGTKLAKKRATTYMIYDTVGETTVDLVDCPDLKYYSFDYKSSNTDMLVEATLDTSNRSIHLQSYGEGTSIVTIYLNGHPMKIEFVNKLTNINMDHHVMDLGDSVHLKVGKFQGKLTWKSTDKSVASVSKDGVVFGEKVGNAVVYAQIGGRHGDQYIGCAVSVVKPGHTEVVTTGTIIGRTCLYSQPMRMKPGFYDCSSLVWSAYSRVGEYFGQVEYAPTAASECQYLSGLGKVLGPWTYEKVQKMVYRPGDLLFRVGADNGRFLGIYHVEMFAGYRVKGFDGSTPILAMCWVNRPDDYYSPGEDVMGRP